MPQTLTARALLFDMDGTLVDSHLVVSRIWKLFADRYALDLDDIMSSAHGVRMVETIRRHAPAGTDAEALTEELAAIEVGDNEGVAAIVGAPAFVASLPAASVALVTSATRELAAVRMAAADIPIPGAVVTAEDVDRGKPEPDCYLAAAKLLGAAPSESIVFEDAEAGILAGLAAGMRVVVVGGWQSEATVGLPRIADYSSVRASDRDGLVTITF